MLVVQRVPKEIDKEREERLKKKVLVAAMRKEKKAKKVKRDEEKY